MGDWVRWLVPDLALMVSVVTLVFCLLLFDGTRKLFRDGDSGWHIRIGEAILDGESLPRTDPFSLLRRGSRWFAWEWGSDVCMGALHRAGGLAYVAGFYAVLIAACSWLWIRLHWLAGGDFLLAAAMAVPMLSTVNMHWLARPHVLGWLLLLGTLFYAERGNLRWPVVALGACLWANLHASFFLGPLLLALYAASYFLRPLLWPFERNCEWARAKRYAIASVVAAISTLANPYGWQLHAHVFRYLSDRELLDRIGEFQSFNFHVDGAGRIFLTVALTGAGGVLALTQRKLTHFVIAVLFLFLGLRSARALPLLALGVLPLANGAITTALKQARGWTASVQKAIDAFVIYGTNLRRLDARFNGLATVPIALFVLFGVLRLPAVASYASFPPDEFPIQASDELAKLPLGSRLLAPDKFGGYLIYRFHGRLPVYFDGRSDFYGSLYMKEYLNLVEVRPGWDSAVQKYAFTHALLPNRYSLIPALEQRGWKKLYSDGVATLLRREQR